MKKLLLITSSLLIPMIAHAVESSCTVAPSCEDLGYRQTTTQCSGKTSVKCPFDETKVFCDSAMIGEIRIWAGPTAPLGWKFCDGAELPRTTYKALYEVIGTTFGSPSTTTFSLPDLNGRVPVGKGKSADFFIIGGGIPIEIDAYTYALGEKGGQNFVALDSNQIPDHQHMIPWGENDSAAGNYRWGRNGNPTQRGSGGSDYDNYWYNTSYMINRPSYSSHPTSATTSWGTSSMLDNYRKSPESTTPHENRMKFLGVNFIIFTGVYN